MILTSGLEEVVCLRERRRQTLWISETLDVSRSSGGCPPYAKLHTAVSMAGFRDAYWRADAITNLTAIGVLQGPCRQDYDNHVDAADSRTTVADRKTLYGVSIGKYLPPQLSVCECSASPHSDLIRSIRIVS